MLPLLAATRLLDAGARSAALLGRARPARPAPISSEIARGHATLSDAEARAAFVHTLRAVVDPGGQRVDASNRLYLAEHVPLLLVWGERDSIIPVAHGRAAHDAAARRAGWRCSRAPGTSRSWTSPSASSRCSLDFIESTEPASLGALGAGDALGGSRLGVDSALRRVPASRGSTVWREQCDCTCRFDPRTMSA